MLEKYRLFNAQLRKGNSGVTAVNDVVLESDGADTGAARAASSASAASAHTLAALRESLRTDISAKLSELGPNVDAQTAMNSILGQLIKDTNAGKYNVHGSSSSAMPAIAAESGGAAGSGAASSSDAPVWLGSGDAPTGPTHSRKTGGRER